MIGRPLNGLVWYTCSPRSLDGAGSASQWQHAIGGGCIGMPTFLEARKLCCPPTRHATRTARYSRWPALINLPHDVWLLQSPALAGGTKGRGRQGWATCPTSLTWQHVGLQPLPLFLLEVLGLPAHLPRWTQPQADEQASRPATS